MEKYFELRSKLLQEKIKEKILRNVTILPLYFSPWGITLLPSNHLSSFIACQFPQLCLKTLATHVLFVLLS